MPKTKYEGRDNFAAILDEGDYLLEVTEAEDSLSKKGDCQLALTCKAEKGCAYDTLTFNERASWRIDTFIKSVGFPCKLGEEVELTNENVVGYRGWAHVIQETWKGNDGKEHVSNKVGFWITDRDKVPRSDRRAVAKADDENADDDEKPPF